MRIHIPTLLLLLPLTACSRCDDPGDSTPPEPQDSEPQHTGDSEPPPPDADGDGFVDDEDCDPDDPAIYPGAPDTPGDGVDSDCNGVDEYEGPVGVALEGETSVQLNEEWAIQGAAEPAVHFLSVQGVSDGEQVTVRWDVEQRARLVLHVNASLQFTVEQTWPGALQEILLLTTTTRTPEISGPDGVPVVELEAVNQVAYTWDDPGTRLAERTLQEAGYPDCDGGTEPLAPPDRGILEGGCDALLTEELVCLTGRGSSSSTGNGVWAVGLDSGTACQLADVGTGGYGGAWSGHHWYACDWTHDQQLRRVDLSTGELEKSYAYCHSADVVGERLVAMTYTMLDHDSYGFYSFDSWLDAHCGRSTSLGFGDIGYHSRITVHDGVIYASRHTTSEGIDLYDLDSGALIDTLELQDYSDWVEGIDVTDDGRLVIVHNSTSSTTFEIFDAGDGSRISQIEVEGVAGDGVSCDVLGAP